MKPYLTLLIAAALHTNTYAQLTNTTSQPQTEKSEQLTHYDIPVEIITHSGSSHKGQVRYKCYGRNKDFRFLSEHSPTRDFVVIDRKQGMDSISRILITNQASTADDKKFILVPIKTDPTFESYMLLHQVEKNQAYTEYRYFQSTVKGFIDDAAPKGSSIPGFYDYFLYHDRANEYYIKRKIKSLKKNILEYVNYCPSITKKVEKKEKGYKQGLLLRDYGILKKVILEASKTCAE